MTAERKEMAHPERKGMIASDGAGQSGKELIGRVIGIPDRRPGGLFGDAIWSDVPRGKKRGPKPKKKADRAPVEKRKPVKYAGFDDNGKFRKLKKFNYFTGLSDERNEAPKQVKQTIEIYK